METCNPTIVHDKAKMKKMVTELGSNLRNASLRLKDDKEIVMIAITAAATFALLDMYAPSISNAARQGTGFGIGANLAGFPQM